MDGMRLLAKLEGTILIMIREIEIEEPERRLFVLYDK